MYQIVLTENKEKLKTLYTYIRKRDAIWRFEKIKSKEVVFPKEKVWRNQVLIPVTYEILLLKKKEEGDTNTIEDTLNDDELIILGKLYHEEEEYFNVTASNRKLSAKEILDHVIIPRLSDDNPKQIVLINNKLVVEGLALNVVTCKDMSQSLRLYNFYREYCINEGINTIMFSGFISEIKSKKEWYKKIHERTGMSMNRLYRKSSR